jgi:formylglycine-generating enzyme required for sulfatase activity
LARKLLSSTLFCILVSLTPDIVYTGNGLVPLATPGPWSGVSELIGYGGRIWFVNSVKFRDHNSADVYSYDLVGREIRYERHLFSQDAGTPTVADGVLYWPFEDSRFSTRHGEYMVTNGRDWQWHILPGGEVFHVHAMLAHRGALFAATGAWRAGLQRSQDGGMTWRVVYDHPTPPRSVSRINTLAAMDDTLYAGLTDYSSQGSKLLKWDGGTLRPVAGWPGGTMATSLTAFGKWIYGVNSTKDGSAVWRSDGKTAIHVTELDGYHVRDLAAGTDAIWAVSAGAGGGFLWRSADGLHWTVAQRFHGAEPLDVLVYAEKVYVGTAGPGERGTLWGPRVPSPVESRTVAPLPAANSRPLTTGQLRRAFDHLDRVLADPSTYASRRGDLYAALLPLALSGRRGSGLGLVQRLRGPFPDIEARRFGGQVAVSAAQMAQWYILWAIGLNGHGEISPALLSEPWTDRPNRSEKYLHPGPAAAWAIAQLGQADDKTIGALIAGLDRSGYPDWFAGDLVGALSVLTGERFGYDRIRWRSWWKERKNGGREAMVKIPGGAFLMGSEQGEPAEKPVHRVVLSPYSLDRYETTNAEFAEFVSASGHVTDAERSGVGWDWDGEWREIKKADWRYPRGPKSSIQGLDRHPVVQVSWNDANAYCRWHGKRLPSEAQWERAARGDGDRVYPWGSDFPRDGTSYQASYGSDRCCRADEGDGYLFTAPVGSFSPGRSPFGVEDLAGNVWEWVEDWFDSEFYSRSVSPNPVNGKKAKRKVIRGGGWGNDPDGLRSTLRHANPPDIGLSMVGFRCAR